MTSVSDTARPPVFVFLGPSGSGKDTQADLLAALLGDPPVISTGALFRRAVERNTPLGQKAAVYMERGEWVPDELVLSVLQEELTTLDTQRGLIFTGFPRTVAQCAVLDTVLADHDLAVTAVFHLDTSPETSIARMHDRIGDPTADARTDDTDELITERLAAYTETIAPILTYYSDRSLLHHVDNEAPIEDVAARIRVIQESYEP